LTCRRLLLGYFAKLRQSKAELTVLQHPPQFFPVDNVIYQRLITCATENRIYALLTTSVLVTSGSLVLRLPNYAEVG
jgi:hypothetical protein